MTDRSRSRLLLLAATPFVPRRWTHDLHLPTVYLDFLDLRHGHPGAQVAGSLLLPLRPQFADED